MYNGIEYNDYNDFVSSHSNCLTNIRKGPSNMLDLNPVLESYLNMLKNVAFTCFIMTRVEALNEY